MKNLVILFLSLIAVAQSMSNYELWKAYKTHFKKSYKNKAEEKLRWKIFMENRRKIVRHNSMYDHSMSSYTMGLNKYSDMRHDEFVRTMNGFKMTQPGVSNYQKLVGREFAVPANIKLPESVDWRKEGAVTPIKDQGFCGSCWAFSSTGALEGQHFLKTGKLVSLSEQNLVDCSSKYGNKGCGGGWMNTSFQYVKDNGGIDTEETYPYEGNDLTCRYDSKNRGAKIVGFINIPEDDEEKLKAAVATIGPISVAIDASEANFQHYKSGIYHEPNGSFTCILNHAVLVVGYGTDESGKDYWLLKNSWGTTWGEAGYFRMSRNQASHCNVTAAASYPLV